MKSRTLLTAVLIACVLILSAAMLIKTNPQEGFLKKRAALVVREIGHRLLLHAGDSSSNSKINFLLCRIAWLRLSNASWPQAICR